MPRSGGSLLNRCIGMLPNTIVLSEVYPTVENGIHSIKHQAKEWYAINLKSEGYRDNIKELYDYCNNHNKKLVIRDHTYLNFFMQFKHVPCESLVTLELLENQFPINTFAFVRNPIDSWISHSNEVKHIKDFFQGYLNFIEQFEKINMKVFKYEDFTNETDEIIKGICEHTGIEYSKDYLKQLNFKNYLGDINQRGRGLKYSSIVPLPRKIIHPYKILRLNISKDVKNTNRKLGYSVGYFGRKIESISTSHLKKLTKKILK